jgi:hypothetical protein
MRNCTGAVLFLVGAWLLYSGLLHRARVVRHSAPLDLVQESTPAISSLAAFGAILRPLILCALGYFAVKITMAYLLLDGGRYFSLFDLGGLLFLLAAYAAWLVLQTRYRPQEDAHVAAVSIAAMSASASASAPARPERAKPPAEIGERRREPAL